MKIILLILCLVFIGGNVMAEEPSSWVFMTKETSHRVNFQGQIIIGGEVELLYSDLAVEGRHFAFRKWFENLTVKELIEKYGFDITNIKEIRAETVPNPQKRNKINE